VSAVALPRPSRCATSFFLHLRIFDSIHLSSIHSRHTSTSSLPRILRFNAKAAILKSFGSRNTTVSWISCFSSYAFSPPSTRRDVDTGPIKSLLTRLQGEPERKGRCDPYRSRPDRIIQSPTSTTSLSF